MRQCGVAESFLATWATEETKREFLDRLFVKLPATDRSRQVLLIIAKNLMEQRSFPDLQNWEDSSQKIKEAHDAVDPLRIHHQRQEEEIQSDKEREEAKNGSGNIKIILDAPSRLCKNSMIA